MARTTFCLAVLGAASAAVLPLPIAAAEGGPLCRTGGEASPRLAVRTGSSTAFRFRRGSASVRMRARLANERAAAFWFEYQSSTRAVRRTSKSERAPGKARRVAEVSGRVPVLAEFRYRAVARVDEETNYGLWRSSDQLGAKGVPPPPPPPSPPRRDR